MDARNSKQLDSTQMFERNQQLEAEIVKLSESNRVLRLQARILRCVAEELQWRNKRLSIRDAEQKKQIDAVLDHRAERITELTARLKDALEENERWVERIKQLEAKLSLVRTVVDGH